MTTAATIAAQLILDASKFSSNIKDAIKSGDTFEKKMRDIGKQMNDLGNKMTIGLTLPILAFGASAVKEAMDTEAAFADLEATIKSTGGVAGVTADAVNEYANKMQTLTKFSDDQIVSGNAMLLTFTKIGKEVFPMASDATLDMAQKFGMDLSQASITLGKALNDPIQGVGALRRIGVALTDQQEAQIKKFVELGDIASAQKIILNELSTEIGGVAQAFGDTAAGKMAIFNNRLNDFKEVIGNAIIPSLIRFMDAMTPILEAMANMSPETVNFVVALLGIAAAAGPVIKGLSFISSAIAFFSAGGAGAGVVTFITGTLLPAFGTFFTFITATAIPAIVAFIAANAAWIVPLLLVAATVYLVYLAFKNNFGGITTTVKNLWGLIKIAFLGIGKAIAYVIDGVKKLMQAFSNVKLPAALTPGSPTPFEMGLRGISSAMDDLSKKSLPKLNAGMNVSQNVTGGKNGSSTYIDNRRFAGGMSAEELHLALDKRFKAVADGL